MVKCELEWIAREVKKSIKSWTWKTIGAFVPLWVGLYIVGHFFPLALLVIFFVVCVIGVGEFFLAAYRECKYYKSDEEKKVPGQFEKISEPFGAKIYYKPLESTKREQSIYQGLRELVLVYFPIIGRIKRYIRRH